MGVVALFSEVPEPRGQNVRHELGEVLFIALAAMLCGGETASDMAEFGRAKKGLLRQVLDLKHGIPSHDTFSRVFRLLDPEAFAGVFARFTEAFASQARIEGVVSFDGKALRRCYEKGKRHMPPVMVSAWGTQTRMALAARLAEGGNEAQAALDMLAAFDLRGCTVTADALHCHRAMAGAVVAAKADYALAVKGNQPALKRDARAALDKGRSLATARSEEINRGRREVRELTVVSAPGMAKAHDFPGLKAVARIVAVRDGAEPAERLFLLSRRFEPKDLLAIVRAHWGIENKLHWTLDVVLDEDGARSRKDHAPANLAILRRLALNVARAHPDPTPMRRKLKRAGWNDDFFLSLCANMR